MNILFVSERFYPHGGAELSLWQLAGSLIERGHKVLAVTSRKADTPGHQVINGIEIYRPFPTGNSILKRAFFSTRLYFYLKEFLSRHQIDIVYNLAYAATLPSTYAAAKRGVPVITYAGLLCGRVWFELVNPASALLNYLMEMLIIRSGKHDALQFQCRDAVKRAGRYVRTRTEVIPNMFIDAAEIAEIKEYTKPEEIRKALNIDKDELFLLSVGHLLPVKNITGLVKVLSKLEVKFRLVWIGEGPERERAEKLIKDTGLEGKVMLLGQRTHQETLSLMSACDVLIHPSKSETGPAVVIEALALERPVISTRVGITPEIKSDNLYLVNQLDEIPRILNSGVTAREDGRIREEYSLGKLTGDYEEFFEALICRKKGQCGMENGHVAER